MKQALSAFILVVALLQVSAASGLTRRFALVVATNDGGPERDLLRYANTDAISVAQVLEELGGVSLEDRTLLLDADRKTLEAALLQFAAMLQAARVEGDRLEIIFYYSGHSDEVGLLLGSERFDFQLLRESLSQLPADVRIAIVDSCSSGELTRKKGGKRRPPFLVDTSSTVKGTAIITSSAASEASQESDRIGASFFTHYLVSALRGAADLDRDGRITLGEAYQFTFAETLARTQRTESGAQHPSYDMQLAGAGDLVLTDLRSTSAGLVIQEEVEGQVYIRGVKGQLEIELNKKQGRLVELSLQPGHYQITVDDKGALTSTYVELEKHRRSVLQAADLTPVVAEKTAARGLLNKYEFMPFEFALLPFLSTNGLYGPKIVNVLSVTLFGGNAGKLYGLGLGLGANWVADEVIGLQLSTGANLSMGSVYGVQFAGGFNMSRGPSYALQLAGGGNLASADLVAAQVAFGTNLAFGKLSGAQLTFGGNYVEGASHAVQMAFGTNIAQSLYRGGQLAVGTNIAFSGLRGAQISGGFNLAQQELVGLQMAVVGMNIADSLLGLQLGVINVADRATGVQLGVVNIGGEVTGLQLGLVNIARQVEGAPLGLISIIGNGGFHPEFWSDDTSPLNVGIKFGSEYVYTLWSTGLHPLAQPFRYYLGFGLGGHVPVTDQFFLEMDLSANQLVRGDLPVELGLDLLNRARITGGWKFYSHLSLIAGLSLNALVSSAQENRSVTAVPTWPQWVVGESTTVHLSPGLHAGIQF